MIHQGTQIIIKGTNIKEALRYFTLAIKKRCTAFLISDFIAENYEDELKIATKRNSIPQNKLPIQTRGRPLMLGEEIDEKVQLYLTQVSKRGGVISTKQHGTTTLIMQNSD